MKKLNLHTNEKIVAYVVKEPLAGAIEKVDAVVVRVSYFLNGSPHKDTMEIEYRLPHKTRTQVAVGLGCEFMLTESEAQIFIKERLSSNVAMVEKELRHLKYISSIKPLLVDLTGKKRNKV